MLKKKEESTKECTGLLNPAISKEGEEGEGSWSGFMGASKTTGSPLSRKICLLS